MYQETVHLGIQCEWTVCHQHMEARGWVGPRNQMGELQSVKVKQRENSDCSERVKTKGKDLWSISLMQAEGRKAFNSILILFCEMDLMLTL